MDYIKGYTLVDFFRADKLAYVPKYPSRWRNNYELNYITQMLLTSLSKRGK